MSAGKEHVPTEDQRKIVRISAAMGLRREQICLLVLQDGAPISENTLRKHYTEELDTGDVQANYDVAAIAYKTATDKTLFGTAAQGNMVRYWLSARAGWKEGMTHEHTGPDGQPLESIDAKWAELERRIIGIAESAGAGRSAGGAEGDA